MLTEVTYLKKTFHLLQYAGKATFLIFIHFNMMYQKTKTKWKIRS